MIQDTPNKILYFCVGCRLVHYDEDYCEEDGDLQILCWKKLLESIDQINKEDAYQESQE